MGDRPAAERACKDPNPIIDGRKANVNLAILGAKPRGNLQTSKYRVRDETSTSLVGGSTFISSLNSHAFVCPSLP